MKARNPIIIDGDTRLPRLSGDDGPGDGDIGILGIFGSMATAAMANTAKQTATMVALVLEAIFIYDL